MFSDESELISRSQHGDVQAFNLLVERFQKRLYTLSYRMLGDAETAADATQEALLSAYRNIRQYHGASFEAWLLRIVTNACYDQLHARRRRPHSSLDLLASDHAELTCQSTVAGAELDERTLRGELARMIERKLRQLSHEQRLAIILSDIEGYSYDEIAAATGWPVGIVKSRLSRARTHLRAVLRAEGVAPARHLP
jgi:RNA polymerase sigma factor (sigma-70 family)